MQQQQQSSSLKAILKECHDLQEKLKSPTTIIDEDDNEEKSQNIFSMTYDDNGVTQDEDNNDEEVEAMEKKIISILHKCINHATKLRQSIQTERNERVESDTQGVESEMFVVDSR